MGDFVPKYRVQRREKRSPTTRPVVRKDGRKESTVVHPHYLSTIVLCEESSFRLSREPKILGVKKDEHVGLGDRREVNTGDFESLYPVERIRNGG